MGVKADLFDVERLAVGIEWLRFDKVLDCSAILPDCGFADAAIAQNITLAEGVIVQTTFFVGEVFDGDVELVNGGPMVAVGKVDQAVDVPRQAVVGLDVEDFLDGFRGFSCVGEVFVEVREGNVAVYVLVVDG